VPASTGLIAKSLGSSGTIVGVLMVEDSRIRELARAAESRFRFWSGLLDEARVQHVAEIGVYRGRFAAEILAGCESIETYYMVDPWRHLDDWNKPANKDDVQFAEFLEETKRETEFAADKRMILRGKTSEVIDEIPDDSLDFVYVDGDHTLRGISIDFICVYPKVRVGGWIGCDDFTPSMWQHTTQFEPTLVFPFAVYFAEAVGARIIALPRKQFLIEKTAEARFEFVDLTGRHGHATLRDQLHPDQLLKIRAAELFSSRPLATSVSATLAVLSSMTLVVAVAWIVKAVLFHDYDVL